MDRAPPSCVKSPTQSCGPPKLILVFRTVNLIGARGCNLGGTKRKDKTSCEATKSLYNIE